MKVLVCGGRDFDDYNMVVRVLSSLQVTKQKFSVIIHGAAKGADSLADLYAQRHIIPVLRFPADWEHDGKAAGPIRNSRMLRDGKPDLVVAFPGGKGTADMVNKAHGAGVDVFDAR